MVTRLKQYALAAWAIMTAGLAALFFYERNKAQVNAALVEGYKLDSTLVHQDDEIQNNDLLLKAEEDKRAALEKEVHQNASLTDIAKYINTNTK